MPGIITRKFRILNAEQLKALFDATSTDRLYMFIARTGPWSNDAAPPTPTDSVQTTDYEAWRRIIALKKISSGDVSHAIPRYNWANNTVYRQYSSTATNLYSAPASSNTFYVLTEDNNLYKCLFNNKGAASTVKPTGTTTSITATADGYRWKFMYNVSAAKALKFLTNDYMPIETLVADDNSPQWDIQQGAANGAIEIIDVSANGSNYMYDVGTITSVASANTFAIRTSANTTDAIFVGSAVYLDSGLGSGELREIVGYVGSTKTVTVNTSFTTTPNTSTTYIIGPKVTISGDGTGALAYSNVNPASSNGINYINMISKGTNYSKATVTITANSSHGSGASVTPYLSPSGGHGSDPMHELSGHNIILNTVFSGNESNTFPVTNDFRSYGIIKNPTLVSTGAIANTSVFDHTTRLTLTSVTGLGKFDNDEIVTGGTSAAKGTVVSFANTNAANTAGVLRVTNANGAFVVAETITGGNTSFTGLVASITNSSLKNFSGEVIYIENRESITRSIDQTEDIKIVVKF